MPVGYWQGRIGDMYNATGDYVRVGDRVELHPTTNRWMRGDRFGEVTKIGRDDKITVKLDKSGLTQTFHPQNIWKVVS